jgi:hypothetical protein
MSPPAAAAETFSSVLLHLYQPSAGQLIEYTAWLTVDIIISAQITRIMIGNRSFDLLIYYHLSAFQQRGDKLAVMNDLEVTAEARILVFNRVIAMRTNGNYFPYIITVHQLDVRGSLHLKEIFVPQSSGRFTAAALFIAEYAKTYIRCLQYSRQ